MSFFTEYLKHPRSVGAVAPSGKALAEKMMEPIDFETAGVIVEYGPGTGSFTKELLARRRPETTLLLIERNERFYEELTERYGDRENLRILHGGAKEVNRYLAECRFDHADYIVSGLPFTSLPAETSNEILRATQQAIGAEGRFITFQYSLVKKRYFERFFRIVGSLRETKNLPPAYVLVMRNYLRAPKG